ncbi:MAG TPA: peptidase inhibitor family I36 protein, partial [Kofleriaceae bacterium]|nr:peptidase inhibitor family I36 protein [Kofleriaceae bacterium]
LEHSEDPAVAALARLFRSAGDLDPPPGAEERVCGALAQDARLPESWKPSTATGGIRGSTRTVCAVEHELPDRAPAPGVRPPRRRRWAATAAIAAGLAILAALTAVVARPQASDDVTVAPRPELRDPAPRESVAPAAPTTDAIAATAPHTDVSPAAEPTPPGPTPPPPRPTPTPQPPRPPHLRATVAPVGPAPEPATDAVPDPVTDPAKDPPDEAPDPEDPGSARWTAVDPATASASGVTSGASLITSSTGGPCRPGFVCVYQNANFRGTAYGVSLGASISNLEKLRCPGCKNALHGNDNTFSGQMSSWDNETDRPYCWYFDTDLRGKAMSMPPHTKRRSVPVQNNDQALSMGPC